MSALSDIYFAAANAARLDGDDALADACMRAATRAAIAAADADHAALYPTGCRVGISQMCEACARRLHGVASPAFPARADSDRSPTRPSDFPVRS